MTEHEIKMRAAELADEIDDVLDGEFSAVLILTVAMVVGAHEARAPDPDIDRFLDALSRSVRNCFDVEMRHRDDTPATGTLQ